jgi:hypothetical protein
MSVIRNVAAPVAASGAPHKPQNGDDGATAAPHFGQVVTDALLTTPQANGQTRSMVFESIHILSSSFRNFISSRTTLSVCV